MYRNVGENLGGASKISRPATNELEVCVCGVRTHKGHLCEMLPCLPTGPSALMSFMCFPIAFLRHRLRSPPRLQICLAFVHYSAINNKREI